MRPSPSAEPRDVLAGRLAEFLAPRGLTAEIVLSQLRESVPEPLLVVATGSVVFGFGNETSDVDLNVVVDRDRLSRLPIISFEHGILQDATYFGARDVSGWADAMRNSPWPPSGQLDRDGWRRRLNELFQAIRFGYGLVLDAGDGWGEWAAELREPWLLERVVEWWRTEAIRWWVGGRWLAETNPLLAAQCHCEAVLAALEVRAARAGAVYFKQKWLPAKLRALGDEQGQAMLRDVLRTPQRADGAQRYSARCEALVDELLGELGGSSGLAAQLWYAPGVEVRAGPGTGLVSRWGMRAVELGGAQVPPSEAGEPIWTGPAGEPPPPHLLDLFAADMTWLSIVAGP